MYNILGDGIQVTANIDWFTDITEKDNKKYIQYRHMRI